MTHPGCHDLAKQANAILRRARCDVITGAHKDKFYHRSKRAQARRFGRQRRVKLKKLGTLGAASPVRVVDPRTTESN
jgi:hypothetical protein